MTLGAVETEVTRRTLPKLGWRFVCLQVHLLVIKPVLQMSDEHAIHPSAIVMHADRNGVALESVNEPSMRELGPLVGIISDPDRG